MIHTEKGPLEAAVAHYLAVEKDVAVRLNHIEEAARRMNAARWRDSTAYAGDERGSPIEDADRFLTEAVHGLDPRHPLVGLVIELRKGWSMSLL